MAGKSSLPGAAQAEDSEVVRTVRFLEAQTHMRDQRRINHQFIRSLELQPGENWLEVGSGSGAMCRLAAPRLLPGGMMVGVEREPLYSRYARRLLDDNSLLERIELLGGDGLHLPFAAGSFDGAFAARLLLNTRDPDAILREMVRVVRPGGSVAAMDWDFETFVVDHSQQELTRRILLWRADHYGSNSWSGRQLYVRLRRAGVERVHLKPVAAVGYGEEDSLPDALRRAAAAAFSAGVLSAAEYQDWVREIVERVAAGEFFASLVYYMCSGRKSETL